MSLQTDSLVNWHEIDSVFLDMDGTLLDLNHDNYFWLTYLPQRYAAQYQMSFEQAKNHLVNHYADKLGTLEWYSMDYWTKELKMDVAQIEEEVAKNITIHPYVIDFLIFLAEQNKRIVLITNAHQKSVSLKMQQTQLAEYFDHIVCAHDLGMAKEESGFWDKLQDFESFNRSRTLFIDDNLSVLRSAAQYGIEHLLAIYQPDSQLPRKDVAEFKAIQTFREIMPF
jgi:5'-nucleotidase